MVLQKRLDYGFNGYQVPAMPRASRSARGRGGVRKKVENNQMCAFDLLATVAGKLLQEKEYSPAPSNALAAKNHHPVAKGIVKQEQVDEENQLQIESCDQGSCNESLVASEIRLQDHKRNNNSKELSGVQSVGGSGHSYVISNPEHSENGYAEELVIGKGKSSFGNFPNSVFSKCEDKAKDGTVRPVDTEARKIGNVINGTIPDTCSTEGPRELGRKPQALVSSDSSVEVPLGRVHVPHSSFSGCRDDVKVVSRDDDENSSGCTQPSNIALKGFRSPPRIGDRRIRKLLASKYWKMAPKLKGGELSNSDGEMKPVHRNKKSSYTRQRSQRNFPFKKRKLFDGSSISTSDGGISSEGISNSPIKSIHKDATASGATVHGASGASSSVAGLQATFQSRDSHVKLRIKSFRVPELFIEIPETATVGSLKRTVMEAVAAVLGDGLRVGVLLQGKKVRDDNKTLLQTGICNEDKLDSLGFTLEPNPTNAQQPSLCSEDPSSRLPSDTPQPLTRYPANAVLDPGTSIASVDPPMTNIGNCVESDHDSVPSTDVSVDKTTSESRALVAVPAMSVEALAVVPFNRKSRRSELVQRRIRRPFSVSEVEALVQAVEKLGTGRWRDVKLRAFDNAKHRTYVDLKDKWKTLVHTARISPQQRRGEPVPQELLDRVLSAHAYWSQQQAKQQAKQQSETCLLL